MKNSDILQIDPHSYYSEISTHEALAFWLILRMFWIQIPLQART